MSSRRWPAYPFLLAVYPVLALAGHNVHERIAPGELLVPASASLYVAACGWVVARFFTRDGHRRAVLTMVAIVLFNGYGSMFRAIQSRLPTIEELLSVWVCLLALAILTVVAALLGWSKRELSGLTAYLNLSAVVLVVLPVIQIVQADMDGDGARPSENRWEGVDVHREGESRPDVIVVILDSYNSSAVLRQYYGFDNSQFEAALSERGFVVPRAARSNYSHTFLSLASMLNGRYLDEELGQVRATSNDKSLLNPLLEGHLLWQWLHTRGYQFVFFPTFYALTADNRNADLLIPSASETSSEFVLVWLRMTPIIHLARSTCKALRCSLQPFDITPEPPGRIEWKLEQLAGLPWKESQILAFMHLLLPHEPFVYDENCRAREVYWPQAFHPAEEAEVKAAYLAQIMCVNRKMIALVDTIMARTDGSALIMLQADHGYGRLGRGPEPYENAGAEQMTERTSVFSAYYLPGSPAGVIYDSITPINAVRGILRHYFGAPLPRLEDRVYFSTYDNPYLLKRLR